MGDKKKQSTLFKFGFSKKIPHRNELQEVPGRSFVEDDDVSLYHCDTCIVSDDINGVDMQLL